MREWAWRADEAKYDTGCQEWPVTLVSMNLDYSSEVVAILALDGDGERLMPLAMERCSSEAARERLRALSGLYVYFSCFEEAHTLAQDIATAEGSYWHAIVHRQEPDAGNAAYWFRQAGAHPIFPARRARPGRRGRGIRLRSSSCASRRGGSRARNWRRARGGFSAWNGSFFSITARGRG